MQITGSNILFSSQRAAQQQHTVKESLKYWVGNRPPDTPTAANAPAPNTPLVKTDQSTWLDTLQAKTSILLAEKQSMQIQGHSAAKISASHKSDHKNQTEAKHIGDPELIVIKMLFEKMFGEKFDLFQIKVEDAEKQTHHTEQTANVDDREGWGLEYERHETYMEAERTAVSAAGIIKTTDGQEIKFKFNLNMSRQFITENHVELRMGDAAKDPLVINFDGQAAQLTNRKFLFDLDADGGLEKISFVDSNSAFLALDRNHDGAINNGNELFGPASGNGFADLSAYDADGNNWIDENDPVFNQLRLWTKDNNGNDQLLSLADKGIGALYLEPINSEFSLKDKQNNLQGQIRSTSLYVAESGRVGTIQQVDLAV